MVIAFKSCLMFYGLILYLLSIIIEGPIRYILNSVGADFIIYCRDILILLIILSYILKSLILGKINKLILITIFLLLFHVIVGLFYLENIMQVLFGIKIMMPLIAGMLVYPVFSSRPKTIRYLFLIFFCISVLGVFLNIFKEFPWEGMAYQIAGQGIRGTEAWSMLGIKRIAGFSRTNFEVSLEIIILSFYLITHIERKLITVPLWLLAGAAIMVTTAKGIIISYLITTVFLIVYAIIPNLYNYYQKSLIVPISIMILLPIGAYASVYSGFIENFKNIYLRSFLERIEDTWPNTFDMVQKHGDLFLGIGVGGIGQSQSHFENLNYYSPGDNLFVYVYVFFGIMSIFYMLYFYKLSQNIDLKDGIFYYLCLLLFCCNGIIQNVIESAFSMIFLGLSLRYIWIKNYQHKMRYSSCRY